MTNYEKIKLALFAIEHNAYIIDSCNREILLTVAGNDEFTANRCKGREELLGKCVDMLKDVMEEVGECVNAMDAMTGIDYELMKIPFDIVYGRKTADDYE